MKVIPKALKFLKQQKNMQIWAKENIMRIIMKKIIMIYVKDKRLKKMNDINNIYN